MTKKELMEFHEKLIAALNVLEDAALILEDEPFASLEPDNEAFCEALRMRIEKLRTVAYATQRDIFSGKYKGGRAKK